MKYVIALMCLGLIVLNIQMIHSSQNLAVILTGTLFNGFWIYVLIKTLTGK